ncbi:twin-arginine translocase TatA/TatE family subunit [bacterium]|nr:twin-arginine translocase TatA/TatE family subunit [bacterium]|tara:strand:+ start:88 stop:336 length:249 start_codon:yes stop_codon:yes gene_type:complete
MMILSVLLFGPGGGEIMVVLLLVLLLFGSKKIPEFAKGLGKGIRQFKDATNGIQKDIQSNVNDIKQDLDVNKRKDDVGPSKD